MRRRRRGTELIEFALCTVFLLPILFGTVVVGLNVGRSIQVTQVSRDAGHMYARSVDFADPQNKDLIVRLARGLNIQRSSGTGVVILSTIMYIGDAQCDAASLSSGCTNRYHAVFVHRVVIGNAAARASSFGTPDPALVHPTTGSVSDYLTDSGARAIGFTTLLPMQAGEIAYVSEVYVPSLDYGMPGYHGTGVYARTIF
jgi:hypothetical protein